MKMLRDGGERLAAKWEQKLMEFPVRLIEKPEYRLAGAEEAVRHIVATIEKILQHHEPLVKDLANARAEAYTRLRALTRPVRLGGRPLVLPPEDTLDLLRSYPKWRFQSLMLQTVSAAYVAMRGHLSDELREINYLRVRLAELARMLETPQTEAGEEPRLARNLYPAGCKTLNEATDQFLSAFTPELLGELDNKVQEVLTRDFTALIHVCMTSKNLLKDVEHALIQTAIEFAGAMLTETNVAEILHEQYPDESTLCDEIAGFYTEAAPELVNRSSDSTEIFILATPPGSASNASCSCQVCAAGRTDERCRQP